MIFRDAIPTDAVDIAKIQLTVWKQAYNKIFPEKFLQQMSYKDKIESNYKWLESLEKTTRVFVAEIKSKQLIGFSVGGLKREGDPLYKGELWGIYILNNYQRKGIGTELFKKVIQHLLNIKINSMLVWVLKDNPYRFFYEKLKGKFVREKQKEFNGLFRLIVSYGWLNIKNIFKN